MASLTSADNICFFVINTKRSNKTSVSRWVNECVGVGVVVGDESLEEGVCEGGEKERQSRT